MYDISGKTCPVTAYDKNGVRLLLHFATDCPPGRPDVLVMVASLLNTAPLPVRSIVLQAAVPKVLAHEMKYLPEDAFCVGSSVSLTGSALPTFLDNESEAAAAVRDRVGSLQPNPSSCCHHSGHVACQSPQGKAQLTTC